MSCSFQLQYSAPCARSHAASVTTCLTTIPCIVFQDLPLSYRFAYVINDRESLISDAFRFSSAVHDILLPSAAVVQVVAYVRDGFGGETRCVVGADFVTPSTVSVQPLSSANATR